MDGSDSPLPSPAADLGLSSRAAWWRRIYAVLTVATGATLLWLMARSLSGHPFGALDLLMLAAFGITLPWSVIGFWNAVIGLVLMRFTKDPVAVVSPYARRIRGDEAIAANTAVLVCVRNEDAARLARNLAVLCEGLLASGAAERFQLYVLSDTNRSEIAGSTMVAGIPKV